jgi:hypothetical protein
MKKYSRPQKTSCQSSVAVSIALVAGALVVGGCGKKPVAETPAPPVVQDTNQSQTAETQVPGHTPPAPPVVVAASPDGGADLKELNHAYINWLIRNNRRAKNFEDFVSASGVQVPPAPAGKKYIIDKNGFINLVNQ